MRRASSWCFTCVGVRLPRPPPCSDPHSSDLPIGRAGEVWKGSTVMMVFVMHHGSTVGSVLRVYRLGAGRVGFQGVVCGLSSRSRSDRGRIASLRRSRLLGTPGREEQLRYATVKELSVLTSCLLARRYKPPTCHTIFELHLFTHLLLCASRSYWESAFRSIVAVEFAGSKDHLLPFLFLGATPALHIPATSTSSSRAQASSWSKLLPLELIAPGCPQLLALLNCHCLLP